MWSYQRLLLRLTPLGFDCSDRSASGTARQRPQRVCTSVDDHAHHRLHEDELAPAWHQLLMVGLGALTTVTGYEAHLHEHGNGDAPYRD